MTDTAQACGNCKWFVNTLGVYGSCSYPVPEWAKGLLLRLHQSVFPGEPLSPSVTHDEFGKDCSTWTPN
jgi:hypothetical protein